MKGCGTFQDLRRLPRRKIDPQFSKLGHTIRAVRLELDISMGELARFLKCPIARLSDLEVGEEADPRFTWCPRCDAGRWRNCQHCNGRGYVEVLS